MKLISPHDFKESILLYGGGGAGKSEDASRVAAAMRVGTMHVYDNDYSSAWTRITASESLDNVQIYEAEAEWTHCIETIEKMIANADAEVDWIVLDSITPTWEWVQSWYLNIVYGHDLAEHLVDIKRSYADDVKGYYKALLDDMNWPAVKKEYSRLYRAIYQWKGHLIITAEAKEISDREKDPNVRMVFGHLGVKPSGESRLHHVCASNLLCVHSRRDRWEINTVKDRKREELAHAEIEDFAVDYLMEVAGWMPVKG